MKCLVLGIHSLDEYWEDCPRAAVLPLEALPRLLALRDKAARVFQEFGPGSYVGLPDEMDVRFLAEELEGLEGGDLVDLPAEDLTPGTMSCRLWEERKDYSLESLEVQIHKDFVWWVALTSGENQFETGLLSWEALRKFVE
jgi:hypothetical protein